MIVKFLFSGKEGEERIVECSKIEHNLSVPHNRLQVRLLDKDGVLIEQHNLSRTTVIYIMNDYGKTVDKIVYNEKEKSVTHR